MSTRKFNRASIVFCRILVVVVVVVAQRLVESIENFQLNNDKSISNSRIVTIVEFFQLRETSINNELISNQKNLRISNTIVVIMTLTILTIFEEFQLLLTRTKNDATNEIKRQNLNDLNDAKIERDLTNLKRTRVKTIKMRQLIKNREKLIKEFESNFLMNSIQLNREKLLKVREFTSYKDSH